jgi:hypothetical protein
MSQIINCDNIVSCFQAIYNFLFGLLLFLAFIYFLFGAFKYLLSGASIFSKDEGKKMMKNSVIAVIIVLVIPVILNAINPGIFNIKLSIPIVKVKGVDAEVILDYLSLTSEEEAVNKYGQKAVDEMKKLVTKPHNYLVLDVAGPPIKKEYWDWKTVFSDTPLKNIIIAGDDDGTEYINPTLKESIIKIDEALTTVFNNFSERDGKKYKLKVTDGYSPNDHKSLQHKKYGTAFDVVVVFEKSPTKFEKVDPRHLIWEHVRDTIAAVGFCVLDERFQKGSEYWTGAHLHVQLCKANYLN